MLCMLLAGMEADDYQPDQKEEIRDLQKCKGRPLAFRRVLFQANYKELEMNGLSLTKVEIDDTAKKVLSKLTIYPIDSLDYSR